MFGHLARFGDLMPQFDGGIAHQVKMEPGYDNVRFSKSRNEIGPHTEAPLFAKPPRYLALFCHRQARCGSGHTALADGFAFLNSLGHAERALIRSHLVDFATYNDTTGYPQGGAQFPLETRYLDGKRILRFSHNLFYYGDLHASNQRPSEGARTNAQRDFLDLVERCTAFFVQHKVEILIPDNAMLIWDNHRMLHARSEYADTNRHLTRYWLE